MNLSTRGFNAAMAAVAAVAVTFFLFAMPSDVFAGVIAATGLPNLLPAAGPPLGWTARALAIGGGATLAAAIVWALLGRIDRIGTTDPHGFTEEGAPVPRLRRADAHPDAPARRPLFAEEDLGEPQETPQPEPQLQTQPQEALAADELPDFLAANYEDGEAVEPEPDAGRWQPAEERTSDDPDRSGFPAFLVANDGDEQEAAELAAFPEPIDEPVPGEPGDAPVVPEAPDKHAGTPTEALMARLPLPEDSGEEISVLFRRLDAGLASCEWPVTAARPEEPLPDEAGELSETTENSVGDRLRSALDDLRKMAGGAG